MAVGDQLRQIVRETAPSPKTTRAKLAGGVAQVTVCLIPSACFAGVKP
jgi:hypothetical protein